MKCLSLSNSLESKENIQYVFSDRIANNVSVGEWGKFLGKHTLKTEYKRSNFYLTGDIVSFINEKLIQKKITPDDLNKFLPKQLTFGKHKDVYLYRFSSEFNNDKEAIKSIIRKKYGINSLEYNEIARTIYFNTELEEEDIVYIKILKEKENKILKLRLIITKKVRYTKNNKYTNKNEPKFEHSYFPIDIDFEERELIVKSIYKEYINIKDYKGNNVSKSIVESIMSSLGLNMIICKNSNQEALYNISKKLLNDVIKERSKSGLDELDKDINTLVSATQKKISAKLGIDINEPGLSKVNIYNEIKSVIENIVLPLILIETNTIEGLISYIKFRDRTAVNAVLKSQRRKDTLLDSTSYLNLRKSLNESKYVEKLRVFWNHEDVSLYYDANDDYSIQLHFYRHLFEEDLNNAIKRFKEFR